MANGIGSANATSDNAARSAASSTSSRAWTRSATRRGAPISPCNRQTPRTCTSSRASVAAPRTSRRKSRFPRVTAQSRSTVSSSTGPSSTVVTKSCSSSRDSASSCTYSASPSFQSAVTGSGRGSPLRTVRTTPPTRSIARWWTRHRGRRRRADARRRRPRAWVPGAPRWRRSSDGTRPTRRPRPVPGARSRVHGTERDRRRGRGGGAPLDGAVVADRVAGRRHQPRLPDPGRAADDHRPPLVGPEQRDDSGELVRSTDQAPFGRFHDLSVEVRVECRRRPIPTES